MFQLGILWQIGAFKTSNLIKSGNIGVRRAVGPARLLHVPHPCAHVSLHVAVPSITPSRGGHEDRRRITGVSEHHWRVCLCGDPTVVEDH